MSSEHEQNNSPARGSLRLAPNVEELEEHKRKLPRQFVNFTFYRARPDWRLLNENEKRDCKSAFIAAVDDFRAQLLIHSYSTVGLRTSADFLIWRIGTDLDPMQEMTGRLNQTEMAKYVEPTHSLLSMTKRSMYIEKECEAQAEDRTHIVPGQSEYLFVCPLQRTREWYSRPQEQRHEMMEENLRIGSKYRSGVPKITGPLKFGFQLGTSELLASPVPVILEPASGVKGNPPAALRLPFHCQPPISLSRTPLPLPKRCPFPNGN